jgi:Tol biopolymer transport system component
MNADGSDPRKITQQSDSSNRYSHPSFAPDGKFIVVSMDHGDGGWKIYIMNFDGSNQILISPDNVHLDGYPSWIP